MPASRRKITPPPRNPTPAAMPCTMRSADAGNKKPPIDTKAAAPSDSSANVRSPAAFPRVSRSSPMTMPSAAASAERRRVGLVGLAIVVTSGLGVVNPLLIKAVFDNALFGSPPGVCAGGGPCPDLGLLYRYVALMVAIPIVTGVIGIGQTYLANNVGLSVMQDLRNRLYEHLQYMPLRFFTTTRTGEIQSRLANDVGGVQTVVTDTTSNILANVVVIASTLIAMTVLSWQLTVLSLALMPLFLWLTVKVGRARREVATNTQKTLADMTTITEETLSVSGILLSKAFGRQRFEIGRFRGENERLTGVLLSPTVMGRSFFALAGTVFPN